MMFLSFLSFNPNKGVCMKYAAVQMKDHQGNMVDAVGVVDATGTIVVSSVARIGTDKWSDNTNGQEGSKMRNLAFADIAIHGFKMTKDADDGMFVEGDIGAEILAPSPLYLKQYMAPNGDIGDPFQNSILDYQYVTGPKGKQTRPVTALFGEGIKDMIAEAVNKSFEILNAASEAGENVRRRNSNAVFSRMSNAVLATVTREAGKRGTTAVATATKPQQNASEGSVTADDALPD